MTSLRQLFFNNRWFLLIVLLSLLLKVALLLQGGVVNSDALTYISAAERHSQGLFSEGLRYYRMPLYPILLAVTHTVIHNWILAGQLLTIFSLVLALWPMYALTQRLFDRQSALFTILLFAVLPEFNTLAIMRDPLFLLFTLSALYFLVIFYKDKQVLWLVVFAMLSVLATLARIEGIILFLIAPLPIFFYWQHLRLLGRNQTRSFICLFLMFITIASVLWGANVAGFNSKLRLNEVSAWGRALLSFDFFSGYQQLMESIKNLQQTLPRGHLRNNLLEITRHYAPLIYCIGLFEVLVNAVFPTSLLAFWAYRWRAKGVLFFDRWLILLPWFTFVLLVILFLIKRNFIQTRYFWIPIVLTLPWIGYGISLWWQEQQQRKIIATVVIVLIIITPLSKTVAVAAKSKDTTIVKAGLWLRDYDPLRQVAILYNDRRLPLYADRISEVTKASKLKHLRKFAQRNKRVELVVLYLSNKKGENYAIEGFEPVKVFKGESKTVVFLRRT